MIVLGLTGSIGMGKSTTAAMFAEEGVPVWDADEAVARLYGPGGAAVQPVGALIEGAATPHGLDREAMRAALDADPALFPRLEAIVHPLVREDREAFLARAREEGAPVALLDIPLLYETKGEEACDAVAVVSAPAQVQRERVLAREGMTAARLAAILARQMPDAEKRSRADFVIDTSKGLEAARGQVRAVLASLASSG